MLHPITSPHVPVWLKFNAHITHGYRPPHTPLEALRSLFSLHNETLNVWTHLLCLLLCLYWLLFSDVGPHVDHAHSWVLLLSDAVSACCFAGSTAYHLFMSSTVSQAHYARLLTFDMLGVILVNVGASIALTWLSLPCHSGPRLALVSLLPAAFTLVWVLLGPRSVLSRASAFGMQWLARVAVIVYAATHATTAWPTRVLFLWGAAECFPLVGAIINISRWPERAFPGHPAAVFAGANSHTLFHLCSAAGILAQHFLSVWRLEQREDLGCLSQ